VTRFLKIKNGISIFMLFYMALGGHTFPADVEGTGSSSWVDVLYFCDERLFYSNFGVLVSFLNMIYILQNELTPYINCQIVQ
jgi:hypothetical protein